MAKITGRTGRRRTSSSTVSQATKLMAQGEWVYGTHVYDNADALVAGTEEVKGSVTAGAGDMLLPYVRFRFSMWYPDGVSRIVCWVAVLKYDSTGAIPTVDDAQTMEQLKTEGRVFHRELCVFPGSNHPTKWMNLEFRNVRLIEDERLALVICPVNALTVHTLYLVDYRKVEV